jgi:hypothetical protein
LGEFDTVLRLRIIPKQHPRRSLARPAHYSIYARKTQAQRHSQKKLSDFLAVLQPLTKVNLKKSPKKLLF